MGSKAVPISDSIGSQLIPRPLGGDQRILHKKRKRCNSPRTSVSSRSSSRSRSPNSRQNRIDASPKEHRLDSTDSIQVKMVSPTLRGMTESARILRYDGIFSFPTETMYSLVSFIPFVRQNKDESCNPTSPNGHWKTLLRLKARDSMKTQRSNSDPPLLYIHRPDYADNYVSFSKLKTFVYKQQLPIETQDQKKDEETKNKFTAVTFSESREVMRRLTSAFWPGPITIFAPAQRVRSRSRSSNSFTSQASKVSVSEQEATRKIPHIITSSCSSLTSLASESVECDTDDQPPILSTNDDDTEDTSPILPVSALRSLNSLLGKDESDDDTYCIGMRCPSHPLACRILAEVYGEKDEKKIHPKARRRIPGAVVGFNASIPITAPLPYSCKDVCSSLLFVQNHHKLTSTDPGVQKPTVHVMNGEDRREMFFVPTCQYGQSSSLSLVIDAPNRTIHLLRDKSYLNSKKNNADFDLKAEDIVRALRHRSEDEPGCVKSKAITGVMQKWKVCEKES